MPNSVFEMPSEKELMDKKQKIEDELKNIGLSNERKENLIVELNEIKADLIEVEAEKEDRNKII